MATTFAHPSLGEILPKMGDGVKEFLGLKYASLENRLSPPKLCKRDIGGAIDATKFGGQKLPVIVFLHGGGFLIGGNSWPQYNFAKLVKLSNELGQPVIGVNINYRLGVCGFLTSEELRNAGYLGNNGLRDQRVSFEWIREHIAGFGGDPHNITVMGESAGGVSLTLHFYSKKPLFSRAISLGGTSLLMKPLPPSVHEMNYKTILDSLGISATSPEERIKSLLDTPSDEIILKCPPGLPLYPVIDGDVVPGVTSFDDVIDHDPEKLPAKVWLKSILIGSNQLDGSIFIDTMENQEGDFVTNFIASIRKNLALFPGAAERVLSLYGISPSLTKAQGVHAVLAFATDIGFFLPAQAFAEGFLGKANVYYFNEPNPWRGRFKGFSSHILDVAFLFQNYNHLLSPAQAESARNFASDFISFANGKMLWKTSGSGEREVKVYGPSVDEGSKGKVSTIAAVDIMAAQRRSGIFQFRENPGLDNLSNAFAMFLAGH